MLVWRKGNINKNCLYVTVLCTIIMEQFLRVGRLYWALILLGLALCLQSTAVTLVFVVLYRYYYFCLHPSFYLLVS